MLHYVFQKKAFDEIEEVLGDSTTNITYDNLQNLRYLEQVIQETWRLFPPIPMIAKKTNEDVHLGIFFFYYQKLMCETIIFTILLKLTSK